MTAGQGGYYMADQEQLDLLKQGVEVWNQWRQKNPRVYLDLRYADLRDVDLHSADLVGANLGSADLRGVDLNFTDLSGSDLHQAEFIRTDLNRVNFRRARLFWTTFVDVDLREATGLETVVHEGPSHIGIETIYRSHGQIPESFLRKAGVPES